jgi:hypothetical protein
VIVVIVQCMWVTLIGRHMHVYCPKWKVVVWIILIGRCPIPRKGVLLNKYTINRLTSASSIATQIYLRIIVVCIVFLMIELVFMHQVS